MTSAVAGCKADKCPARKKCYRYLIRDRADSTELFIPVWLHSTDKHCEEFIPRKSKDTGEQK